MRGALRVNRPMQTANSMSRLLRAASARQAERRFVAWLSARSVGDEKQPMQIPARSGKQQRVLAHASSYLVSRRAAVTQELKPSAPRSACRFSAWSNPKCGTAKCRALPASAAPWAWCPLAVSPWVFMGLEAAARLGVALEEMAYNTLLKPTRYGGRRKPVVRCLRHCRTSGLHHPPSRAV